MPKIPSGPFTREQLEAFARGEHDRETFTTEEARQVMAYDFLCAQQEPWAAWIEAYARRLHARYLRGDESALAAAQEAFLLANDLRLGREPQSICPDPPPPPRRTP